MPETPLKLRILDAIVDVDPHTLPVAFEGLALECSVYAQNQGYKFKPDSSLFGGYYSHPQTGTCLIPTY